MDQDRVRRLRDEVRETRRHQGVPSQLDAQDAIDEIVSVLLSVPSMSDRLLGDERRGRGPTRRPSDTG